MEEKINIYLLGRKLLQLKKRTGWSWEKMNREFHRVTGVEGPSHTTLFRLSKGMTKTHPLIAKYISNAITMINQERVEKIMDKRARGEE